MKTKTIKLSPEVIEVLKRSTIDENSVKLPDGQLERSLYVAVDKALRAAGGKWNKKSGSHLFPSDPRPLLGLESGEVVNIQQTFQEFFTPKELATQMCNLVKIENGTRVLEPSAGIGNIVRAAARRGADVTCIELQEKNAEFMRSRANEWVHVHCRDFLEVEPKEFDQFDVVLANPPFTKGLDRLHTRHAMSFLRPGGRLVTVMSGGTESGTSKSHREFHEWLSHFDYEFIPVPAGTFKESGTGVNTVLLVIDQLD